MKQLLRNVILAVYHYTGAVSRYRTRQQSIGPLARVVCFHDIQNQEWFETVIRRLHNECTIVSPQEWKQKVFDNERVNVLLTFDDGYHSWLEVVAPILESHSLKALFFISSGVFAVAGDETAETDYCRDRLRIRHRQLLSESSARALHAAGHTIGGHTVNHIVMSKADTQLRQEEVAADKASLEGLVGHTIHDFAYPFGTSSDSSSEVRSEVRSAGYTHTYSAIPGFAQATDADTPRLLIDENQSPEEVMRWIDGSYDLYYRLKSRIL